MSKCIYDVFVSYRWVSPDREWVREQLVPKLRAAGLRVFLDVDDFVPGRNLILEMSRAHQESRKVLCIFSPEYFESGRMVFFESLAALGSDPAGNGSRLIPLIIRSTELPAWLSNVIAVDWINPGNHKREWKKLLSVLGADITVRIPRVPEAVPDRLVPNNLPRLDYFFGRTEELAIIATALDAEARTWGVFITGIGGIGKTALAIRAAELAPTRFKRVIFVSAKQRELTPDGIKSLGEFILPGYLEMLNAIAREIGGPEYTQAPESERSYLVRRALEKTSILLVLDNLEVLPTEDHEKWFAFLGSLPRSCSAIVTSRYSRTNLPAIAINLGELGQIDALRLIDRLAKQYELLQRANEVQRLALYQETGGNPLLIRWVAGQLGLGRCLTVDSALDFLRSAPQENDPLEYVFGNMLDTTTDGERKILAVLSYVTGARDVELVSDLAGIATQVAKVALGTLSNRALVIPDVEEQRFSLAPMVAVFLRRSRTELMAEMGNRLETRAYDLIMQNGYLQYERYPTLQAAWPILVASLPLFLAGSSDRLQRICDALHIFLEFTGHWDEWLSLNEKAEQRAVGEEDYFEAGWRALQAGRVHRLRHQADAVFACADRVGEHWAKTRSPDYHGRQKAGPREEGDALTLRGKGHYLRKDYPAAIEHFTKALQVLRPEFRTTRDYTSALNGLADAERFSRDLDQAKVHYDEALDIAQRINSPNDIAAYTGNLAALAIDRKDYPLAERLAREALTLAKAVGRQESIAADYRRLSEACDGQGKRDEGQQSAEQAAKIYERLGSPYEQIAKSLRSYWNL